MRKKLIHLVQILYFIRLVIYRIGNKMFLLINIDLRREKLNLIVNIGVRIHLVLRAFIICFILTCILLFLISLMTLDLLIVLLKVIEAL
jgi:hypothetical protein